MKISSSALYALSLCAAVAILAGCSNGGPQSQLGPPAPIQQNAAQSSLNTQSLDLLALTTRNRVVPAMHVNHRPSWMDPDAKKQDLLYISDPVAGDVDVYSYPRGKLKGMLTDSDAPYGECSDKAGNVWIANFYGADIVEYAHGGTSPINTLSDPGANGYPIGCSVDSTTGNLAVSNFDNAKTGAPGDVLIYADAQGTPTTYTVTNATPYWPPGYDNKGNLFVQVYNPYGALAELPKGRKQFKTITLNVTIYVPGSVQWHGKYLAVDDQAYEGGNTTGIYQVQISGSSGTAIGSEELLDSCGASDVVQFWIQGNNVVGPNVACLNVGIYKYPAGGTAIKTLTGFQYPNGATVSLSK